MSIVDVFRVTFGEPGNERERLIAANSAERALEVVRPENLIPRRTLVDRLNLAINEVVVRICARARAPRQPEIAIVPRKRPGRPRKQPA
jgi:hypothetical protein